MEERKVITKHLYKVELIILKFIPMLLALLYFLNTVLPYFNIDVRILNYLGGLSLIPLIFLYVSSYVFKFCFYHRIFLHYIVINYGITVYDEYIGIPLDNFKYVALNCIVAFLIIFIATCSYVNRHNKNSIIEIDR